MTIRYEVYDFDRAPSIGNNILQERMLSAEVFANVIQSETIVPGSGWALAWSNADPGDALVILRNADVGHLASIVDIGASPNDSAAVYITAYELRRLIVRAGRSLYVKRGG